MPQLADKENEKQWRTFQVLGSISLAKLHSIVLVPLLGWDRALHAYPFESIHDGATFGPTWDTGFVDMMHVPKHHHYISDDRDIPLAMMCRGAGDW